VAPSSPVTSSIAAAAPAPTAAPMSPVAAAAAASTPGTSLAMLLRDRSAEAERETPLTAAIGAAAAQYAVASPQGSAVAAQHAATSPQSNAPAPMLGLPSSLEAALQRLPASFADAPPAPRLPTALRPRVGAEPTPLIVKIALALAILGALTGVALVVYFVWFERGAGEGTVRIVTVSGEELEKRPMATSGEASEKTIAFPPIHVQRKGPAAKRPSSSETPGKAGRQIGWQQPM